MPPVRPVTDQELTALRNGQPPVPRNVRFKPLRLGLLGMWQYQDQEFIFHDGRLILSGRNGSGKTKVLEVTSPFLFDANLSAHRLDPFGSKARPMRENLLYGGRSPQIGYVWCEYGRLTEEGEQIYLTVGAGMKAWDGQKGAPDSWYFVTPRRVGVDFNLHANGYQHSEADLIQVLGADAVFSIAEHYRTQVADLLFGISLPRLNSLVDLLLILRRPKLSENLNVERLAAILSEGLPPIGADQIDKLAKGFDDLADDQEQLDKLVDARVAVERFLEVYGTYAKKTARHLAGKLLAAQNSHRRAIGDRKKSEANKERVEASVRRLKSEIEVGRVEKLKIEERVRVAEAKPEAANSRELAQLWEQVEQSRKVSEEAWARRERAQEEFETVQRELESAEQEVEDARRAFDEITTQAEHAADRCGLGPDYASMAAQWTKNHDSIRNALAMAITGRQAAINRMRDLLDACVRTQHVVDQAQAKHDDLTLSYDQARAEVASCEDELDRQSQALVAAIEAWVHDSRECQIDDQAREALLDAVEDAANRGDQTLARLVDHHLDVASTRLRNEHARLNAVREQLTSAREAMLIEREEIAQRAYPTRPQAPMPRRPQDDMSVPGSPLWKLVDFVADLSADSRDALEGALLGAGVLDAWITPDGAILDPNTMETFVVPGSGSAHSRTLHDVLVPIDDGDVSESAVRQALACIGYADGEEDHEQPWISARGAWAIGPLRGFTEGHRASYIGEYAREEARSRELAEADERLADLDQALLNTAAELATSDERLLGLDFGRAGRPVDQMVRTAATALDAALERSQERFDALDIAKEVLKDAEQHHTGELSVMQGYADGNQLPTSRDELGRLGNDLVEFGQSLADVAVHAFSLGTRLADTDAVRSRIARQGHEVATAGDHARRVGDHLARLEARYEAKKTLFGAPAQQWLAELEQTTKLLRETDERLNQLQRSLDDAGPALGEARSGVRVAEDALERMWAELEGAASDLERARRRGLLRLMIVLDDVDTGTEDPVARSLADAKRIAEEYGAEDITGEARDKARNLVDDRYHDLQRDIGGVLWRPWGENDGDLFIVRITFRDVDHEVPHLLELLTGEIDTRRAFIEDRERDLFADVLLGSVGEHLRQRRREAKRLVDNMNKQLDRHPTASEVKMQLEWRTIDEATPDMRRALDLLDSGSTHFLDEAGRKALIEFLSARVAEVRAERRHGDWKEDLKRALDYRTWHTFELQVKTPDKPRWTTLNEDLHRKGSGGEKAVMLQLPLFAAAAAHYEGTARTAPRPVYLDEAFAGVDVAMRASCMGLLAELDLDFVMASHDETGFHSTVPGVATYQLFRDPQVEGVLTTLILWDGRRPHRLDDPALRRNTVPPVLDFGQDA